MTKHEFEIQQLKDEIEYHQDCGRMYLSWGNTEIANREFQVARKREQYLAELQEKMRK